MKTNAVFQKCFIYMCATFVLMGQNLPAQVNIVETLTRVDPINLVDDQLPVDNFELEFHGNLSTWNVRDLYNNIDAWGMPARLCDFLDTDGFEVTWFDRVHPIEHGAAEPFGIDLEQPVGYLNDALPDIDVSAYWTRIEKELIPFVSPSLSAWDIQSGIEIYFLMASPLAGITRAHVGQVSYAYTSEKLSLDNLYWNAPVGWMHIHEGPTRVSPLLGGVNLSIPGTTEPAYLQLQYSIADTTDSLSPIIYVNYQFTIDTNQYGTLNFMQMDMKFDLTNITSDSKDNLELDWIGYARQEDIKEHYIGSNDWGIPPRIQEFEFGSLPPIISAYEGFTSIINWEGGLEITWMNKCDPLQPNESASFGFSTGIGVQPGKIWDYPSLFYMLLYWTKVIKVDEAPVPWQWWQTDPNISKVRDIVTLTPDFPSDLAIKREYAVIDKPLPIDSLAFSPNISSRWTVIDNTPAALSPGGTLSQDISLSGRMYGAVLVRYTIYDKKATSVPLAYMINQAEFYDPKPVGVDLDIHTLPDDFYIGNSYPNPFNMTTQFRIALPKPDEVSVIVYNATGQKVRELVNGALPAGTHTISWDGLSYAQTIVPSGVYFCRILTKQESKTIKMLLAK